MIVIDTAPTGETDPHARRARDPELLLQAHLPHPAHGAEVGAAGGQAHDRHAAALRRRAGGGEGDLRGAGGHGPAAPGPEAELDPHRPQPRAHGHQRVAAPLHLPRASSASPWTRWSPTACCRRRRARAYFDKWFGIQAGHLAEARKAFDPLPFFEARLFDREMVGLPLLDEFARDVFGDRDPTAGLLPGEADRGEEGEGRATRCTSACPSRRRTRSRSGRRARSWSSRSIISGATSLLPRTLASRRLLGAAFEDQRLRVAFGEKEDHGAS